MNKINYFIVWILLFLTYSITLLSQVDNPNKDYEEITFTDISYDNFWQNTKDGINISWIPSDMRLEKNIPPHIVLKKQCKVTAWRGESINLQMAIWSKQDLGNIEASINELKGPNKSKITADNIDIRVVRYTVTDELNKDLKGTCGYRPDKTLFDSLLVADVLDIKAIQKINAKEVRPFWIKIKVPSNTPPGIYKGNLYFKNLNTEPLSIEIKVMNHVLPESKEWRFQLDLWQNPFAVARYYDVPLWGKEHMELMKPIMKILADAGQKTITASIMHKPWNGQTYDHFESMIMRVKRLDGSWYYNYAVFDKWIEFMTSMGIDQQINCFTMIPWDLKFQYFDQASDQLKSIKTEPGTSEFENYWLPFLKSFASHLKEKKWFEKTTIAMDERPMENMRKVIELIKKADPDYKISLAGNYHPEIESDLYDYCIALDQLFPKETLERRKTDGRISTLYTCCSEPYPNTFTFSPPAEAAWFGWYAAAKELDGYSRWAYNSWNKDPLVDTRFTAWGAGDCFFVYPGGRTSIRMEKLIEGIQDYEKIRILKDKFLKENNKLKLTKLTQILETFDVNNFPKIPASETISKARKELNKL